MNSSRIASKLFKSDDWPSNNSANQVSVMPDNRMMMNLTWASPSG